MWRFFSGALLGWGLGSNDAANVFGTGVATGVVRFRTAAVLIAFFVLLGAIVEGPKVMHTVGNLATLDPMTAFLATFSAAIIMFIMSALALPTSSSQAIIGALVAVGLLSGSTDFAILTKVFICWILTPIGAALISILLYQILGYLLQSILRDISLTTIVLRIGIIVAGCYGAYALGGNNVANVSGVYVGSGQMTPLTASLFGGLAIALGVLTFSKNVMMTVGQKIFPLDEFSAFIAVISQAITVNIFTQIGVPVSSSQAIVGAVVGIGLIKNMDAIKRNTIFRIVFGWLATPTMSGAICFLLMQIFL